MALQNPSVNCFRKFKRLQLTFQVVTIHGHGMVSEPSAVPQHWRFRAHGVQVWRGVVRVARSSPGRVARQAGPSSVATK